MKQKLFTLLTLLVLCVTGAWADDVCTATQTFTDGRATCTWTSMNVSVAKNSTKAGNGLYFVAGSGGTITTSSGAVNIKSGRVMYVQVPSSASTGTITIYGSQDKYTGDDIRTVKLNSNKTIAMKTAGDNADFVASDVENVNGGYYIKVSSTSDFKFNQVKVTLNNSETYPYSPALSVSPQSVSLNATTILTSPTANFTLTGTDLYEMDGSELSFESSVAGLSINKNTITVTDGEIAAGDRTYTITYAPTTNVDAASVTLNILAKTGSTTIASTSVTVNYSSNISDTEAPTLSSSTPEDNATGITSVAEASFTFSENVTLVGAFSISPNSGVTIETPVISGAKITVPLSGLAYGTTYTLSLAANGIEDLAGNAYASALSKTFTTLDAPVATKTWNFKSALSSDDVTNLTAGVGTTWTYDSSNDRYKNKGTLTSAVLMANGKAIEKTAGLLFTTTGDDQLRVDNGTRLMIKNTTNALVIPNLKANDEVIIVFSSGNNSATRTITVSNATLEVGSASSPNYDEVTAVYKVTADGNVAVKGSDWMRIYSISVGTNSDNAVNVTSANYATFVTQDKIDFSKSAGVTAYKAEVNGDAIDLTEVTAAPSGTPLIIAATSDSYLLTVSSDTPAAVTGNDLLAGPVTDSDGTNYYVLGKEGSKVGFGLLASGVNLPATKAYIPATKFTSGRAFYGFDDEATGIKTVEEKKALFEGGFYNLSGQKVIKPAKGLYIVNGKKVVVK